MAPRNHAACIGNDDVLSGEIVTGRSLLAQFGLTPKLKRGLVTRDAVDCRRRLETVSEVTVGRLGVKTGGGTDARRRMDERASVCLKYDMENIFINARYYWVRTVQSDS